MSEFRTIDEWPNCATPDCQYKRNLRLGTIYCFQCSCRFLRISEEEGRRRIEFDRAEKNIQSDQTDR